MRKLPGSSYDSALSRKMDGREDRFWYEERGRYLRRMRVEKKDKLVNRRDAAPAAAGSEGSRGKNNHARRAVRSLAHATCTGRELLTNARAVTVTRRAHLMRLRVCYAPYVPSSRCTPGTGDNCVLRQGKGISAYMRHNTICDASYVHLARPRGIYATARQRARLPCALRRIAVRRLMENALLPLNAVLRLPTIQSHLSTYGTARVEDLTRTFSRERRFKCGDNSPRLNALFAILHYKVSSMRIFHLTSLNMYDHSIY